jgi:hypothetical protein
MHFKGGTVIQIAGRTSVIHDGVRAQGNSGEANIAIFAWKTYKVFAISKSAIKAVWVNGEQIHDFERFGPLPDKSGWKVLTAPLPFPEAAAGVVHVQVSLEGDIELTADFHYTLGKIP